MENHTPHAADFEFLRSQGTEWLVHTGVLEAQVAFSNIDLLLLYTCIHTPHTSHVPYAYISDRLMGNNVRFPFTVMT